MIPLKKKTILIIFKIIINKKINKNIHIQFDVICWKIFNANTYFVVLRRLTIQYQTKIIKLYFI